MLCSRRAERFLPDAVLLLVLAMKSVLVTIHLLLTLGVRFVRASLTLRDVKTNESAQKKSNVFQCISWVIFETCMHVSKCLNRKSYENAILVPW